MELTTERLTLRPFREDDVQALYDYSCLLYTSRCV